MLFAMFQNIVTMLVLLRSVNSIICNVANDSYNVDGPFCSSG